jgi:general secretion pathway protein K
MRERSESQRGIILFAVLLAIALLSVMAATSIEISRTEQQIARNVVAQTQAKAFAETGVTLALVALLSRDQANPWPIDGTPHAATYETTRLTMSIQDEFGKIDLNFAQDDTLRNLFLWLGSSPSDANAIVDAIGDWRDPDDLKRLNGAEKNDYRAAGRPYGPRNAPFESVAELAQVLGVSRDLAARARPALTVYSRRPFIDPTTAPTEVLKALPGMDQQRADAVTAGRPTQGMNGSGPAPAAGTTAALVDLTGRVFTITVSAKLASGAAASRTAVIRFTGDPRQPYWVHEWR